jgi:hypothetical protein
MPTDPDRFDLFISYAHDDDNDGRITRFLEELQAAHQRFTGEQADAVPGGGNAGGSGPAVTSTGRDLTLFFDRHTIRSLDDWQHRIADGLAHSRLFLAFLSPRYFASEWCRREWKTWIDHEIAKHILSQGAAPIYVVEVPGLVGRIDGLAEQRTLTEREVAERVAELCGIGNGDNDDNVDPKRAGESESTVPPYNVRFSGRLDELLWLRHRLQDDRAGVVCGVHGLGGIGKTELAFTYAHAFASAYPGGRFLVACETAASLREAIVTSLGGYFASQIDEEAHKTPDTYFAAVTACLRERLHALGHILLVLDNVVDPGLVTEQTLDCVTSLGPTLHVLATTRLEPPAHATAAGTGERRTWLTLGALPDADALDLLEKYRPFGSDPAERAAAVRIVERLGGFTLAVELVAAWLAAQGDATSYASFATDPGLEDLEDIASAGEHDAPLRRHNDERRLTAVLRPVLDSLDPPARRALEYASFLAPDSVPLDWLESLVTADFPETCVQGVWSRGRGSASPPAWRASRS